MRTKEMEKELRFRFAEVDFYYEIFNALESENNEILAGDDEGESYTYMAI